VFGVTSEARINSEGRDINRRIQIAIYANENYVKHMQAQN